MEKDFNQWNEIKKGLDKKDRIPTFKEREIWWCNVGLNIGHEENGKGKDYSRPVLIIKKFNNYLFWGIPLTTQIKEKHYYHKINFKNQEQCVMLSQQKPYTSKRLMDKMGELSNQQFQKIRKVLIEMLS